ncbi:MAG: amidase, partial [Phycicoccus sp.]
MNRRQFTTSVVSATVAAAAPTAAAASSRPAPLAARPRRSGNVDADVLYAPLTTPRRLLRRRAFSSVELTHAYLDRIDRLDTELNSFVQVDRAGALRDAAAADSRIAAGERTPMLGIPVGVKDLVDVRGLRTTYGSRAFAENVADGDASSTARLRKAGAVILGKTNTTEFALGSPNTIRGSSKNPWDLARTAGGSSNGSGTAASAALVSATVGTDTAGSIRTPSSFCGIYGLKPTFGRVSTDRVGVLSTFMDTVGPMGRSVADVAALLQVMAGYQPDDITSADVPVPDYTRAPRRTRLVVGAPETWVTPDIDPEVRSAWRQTL